MCKKQVIKKLLLVQNDLTKRLFKSIIDTQLKIDCDLRLCWNWQTGKLEVLVSERVYGFESRWPHHKRNLFCLPRQERFFLAFRSKYRANHRKMGFGAVDRLLRSPIFCFQRQKQSENVGVHIEFLCFASNY